MVFPFGKVVMLEFLFLLLTCIEALLITLLIGLVLLVIGMVAMLLREEWSIKRRERVKARHRKQKEEAAWAGYFFINFHHGFDSTGAVINRFAPVPTDEGRRLLQEMDDLADSDLFDKTEEIRDDFR